MSSLANPLAVVKVKSVHQAPAPQVKTLHRLASWLRDGCDTTGWKHEAVAKVLGVSETYFADMLAERKPISGHHLMALPPDIQEHVSGRWAEATGHIVVHPVEPETAMAHLIAGLAAILAGRFPGRASHMAKADL